MIVREPSGWPVQLSLKHEGGEIDKMKTNSMKMQIEFCSSIIILKTEQYQKI